jgi:single-stranded DNA-specific DHH superfamily exonuclease
MPLATKINRFFVNYGIKSINNKEQICWYCLEDKIDSTYIAFQVTPKVNSSVRMTGKAITALNYLLSDNIDDAFKYWQELSALNDQRKQIQEYIYNKAI